MKTIDDFTRPLEYLSPLDRHLGSIIREWADREVIPTRRRYDEDWKEQLKLYARQPLSFHRAPVNINTASDKVLTALLLGLQTTWGRAGYLATFPPEAAIKDMGGWAGTSTEWADAMWQCTACGAEYDLPARVRDATELTAEDERPGS